MDSSTVAIIVAFVGGPAAGAVVTKYVRPRASVIERLESLEARYEKLEDDHRVLQDYTHQLRQHIAVGQPPPPPPWPEGLRQ